MHTSFKKQGRGEGPGQKRKFIVIIWTSIYKNIAALKERDLSIEENFIVMEFN